jgi:hypothetical protein
MKNYKISYLLFFAVLVGLIYSCKKENDSDVLEMPETLSASKTCINVGMEDTLWVSMPSHVGGATAYEWTAACSDGSDVKISPTDNDLSMMVTTSNPTYGSQLTVSVKAQNAEEYSPARELAISIEGVGTDYKLVYDDSWGSNAVVTYRSCSDSLCYYNVIGSDLEQILWYRDGLPVPELQQDAFGGYTYYPTIPATERMSAILIPSAPNGCKSKMQ